MGKKYLVTYASRYGSTAEIALRIDDILKKQGLEVEGMPLAEITDLTNYSGVILGSPIYSGEWSPDMLQFIDKHKEGLRQLPVAIFATALRLRDNSEEMRQSVMGTLYAYRVQLKPIAIGLFAGALDYSKLSPIVYLQLKGKNLPEGDFRDWNLIEAWAQSLPELFAASIPTTK